ncbi:hypothetical protein EVAR_23053_1 [Eumeta japonica]|uniref:Uncharacterized protein n=1 Tax=Eumeta variegata TaxID=151549 RepID=A0A4C1VKU7_EUMVA|nr:hypothetical protein EVAR_23053_1 [Eumeta japonica]
MKVLYTLSPDPRCTALRFDQLDESNLDQLNLSGPDFKISSRPEVVPTGQLCYLLTSIPGRSVTGVAIWRL